ncbi:hypothetical protein QUF76_05620 [Desulfobacterales bacterium HSG16]|nr:hypothetical protein [Desulfobacterales bacterium HSG16]
MIDARKGNRKEEVRFQRQYVFFAESACKIQKLFMRYDQTITRKEGE